MPETSALGLPLLVAEQAQKHVTHNEALAALDAIVQLAVLDRDLTAPPGSPSEGDRYIVGSAATGEWAGRDGEIVAWQGGAWAFYAPKVGWRTWIEDEGVLLIWTGAAWNDIATLIAVLQNLALLGIGTTADATNPLSAKLNNALWTAKYDAEGGDGSLRYKMNKEAAEDVLSLLLQTDFSARAEVGLIGDDDLVFKVSPDGSTWHEAIRVDKDNGDVQLPQALIIYAPSSSPYLIFQHGLLAGYPDKPTFDIGWIEGSIPSGLSAHTEQFHFGFNVNGSGNRDDTSISGMSILFEQNLRQNASGYANDAWVLRHIRTDGTARGCFTMEYPQDGPESEINLKLQVGSLAIVDATTGSSWAALTVSTQLWNFYSGITLSSEVNNKVFFRQLNAAGSGYVNALYVDSSDRIQMQGAVFIQGTPSTATGLLRIQNTEADPSTNGRTMINVAGGTITGQAYLVNSAGSFSAGADFLVSNTNTTAATAYAALELRAGGASGGDSFVRMRVIGGSSWSAGIDNSDSDAFVIAASTALGGANNRLRIDADKIDLLLPPKLPSYTVAGAPSASTLGGGSVIYVSNEAGGATLAFSDGSNWKRVSDLATIS